MCAIQKCTAPWCNDLVKARGLCNRHYYSWLRDVQKKEQNKDVPVRVRMPINGSSVATLVEVAVRSIHELGYDPVRDTLKLDHFAIDWMGELVLDYTIYRGRRLSRGKVC